MICIIFSSLCLSTLAFSSPSDSLCLSHIHHVPFWAPGAFSFSCNTVRMNTCGLLLYFYFPKKEKQTFLESCWHFSITAACAVTDFAREDAWLLWLRCTVCLASQTICTYVFIFLEASPSWQFKSLSSLQLVLLKVLTNWMTEGFRF